VLATHVGLDRAVTGGDDDDGAKFYTNDRSQLAIKALNTGIAKLEECHERATESCLTQSKTPQSLFTLRGSFWLSLGIAGRSQN